jgi:hypothetical protein
MMKFALTTIVVLSFGIGAAFAHPVVYHNNIEYWGPPEPSNGGG